VYRVVHTINIVLELILLLVKNTNNGRKNIVLE
jgi:hypothetical protein